MEEEIKSILRDTFKNYFVELLNDTEVLDSEENIDSNNEIIHKYAESMLMYTLIVLGEEQGELPVHPDQTRLTDFI